MWASNSVVTPFRNLPISDPQNQVRKQFGGISLLWTKFFDASKAGGIIVKNKVEAVWGFKEISAQVNTSGVVQEVWMWNILGGVA
jgi:hypothetical protein